MKKTLLFIAIILSIVACQVPTNKFLELTNNYYLDYVGGQLQFMDSVNNVLIKGHILDYKYDSVYIVIEHKLKDSIPECANSKGMNYKVYKKAFDNSPFRQYWIVNLENNNIYGPYKFDTYILKKQELNISNMLKLEVEK